METSSSKNSTNGIPPSFLGAAALTAFHNAGPSYYDGRPDFRILKDWTNHLEFIVVAANIDESMLVKLAAVQLLGPAGDWWANQRAQGRRYSWTQFKEALAENFSATEDL